MIELKNLQEDIQKFAKQNVDEFLNELYTQSVNEGLGDKIGTRVRNAFSWGSKGKISPKAYAAARDFGRAFSTFKAAWEKCIPFLGDDPNAENYDGQKPLKHLEKAVRTIPRLKGVENIERPTRAELIGRYFVSDKNFKNVAKKHANPQPEIEEPEINEPEDNYEI